MKLSKEQIERLYRFTREHFVEWYDLQTELVDHLANAIESKWNENPNLSFEETLQSEFKKFGVFGFMDVVEKRQIALNQKYNKLVWKHFKEFFALPKILLSFGFVAVLFFVMKQVPDPDIFFSVVFVSFVAVALTQIIKHIRYQNRKTKPDEKRWLFLEVIRSYGNLSLFFVIPIQLLTRIANSSNFFQNTVLMLVVSAFIVAYSLAIYIIMYVIPSKAENYLHETYPEYRLENV